MSAASTSPLPEESWFFAGSQWVWLGSPGSCVEGSSPRSINPGWLIWGVPESPKTAQWFINPGFTLSKTFKVFINWPSKGPVSSPVAAHLYIHSLPSIRERMQIMPLLRFTVPNFWQSTVCILWPHVCRTTEIPFQSFPPRLPTETFCRR